MSRPPGLPAFFQTTGTALIDELNKLDSIGPWDSSYNNYNSNQNKEEPEEDTFNDNEFGDFDSSKLPAFFSDKNHDEDDFPSLDQSLLSAMDAEATHTSKSPAQLATGMWSNGSLPAPADSKIAPALPPGLQNASTRAPPMAPVFAPVAPAISDLAKTGNAAPIAPGLNSNSGGKAILASLAPAASTTAIAPTLSPAGALPTASVEEKHVKAPGFNSNNNNNSNSDSSYNNNRNTSQKFYRNGKFMSGYDIRYVVGRVMQPIETSDPFSDDFYSLQLRIKKNAKLREDAIKNGKPMPSMIYVPLPTWKETKERIILQMEQTKNTLRENSRKWEEKEQVLGHLTRLDISRPREQLSVPTLSELSMEMMENDDGSDLKMPFTTRLWTIRQAVQRGLEALYTVQELNHLMTSPAVFSNPEFTAEVMKEIDTAVTLLSQSIGIRIIPESAPIVGLLGQVGGTYGSGGNISGSGADFSLDGGHLGAILQITKGKKLINRSIKLLSPPHRWALIPVILARLLQTPPNSTATINPENAQVEQQLIRTIIEFLQYSYQFQIERQSAEPEGSTAAFTNVLLINLRQCVKSVMVSHMEKVKLRQALVSDKSRAEVMHVIVQIGDKIARFAEKQLSLEWVQMREAFMSMLDS